MAPQSNSQETATVIGDTAPITPENPETTLATPPDSTELRKRLRDATQKPKERSKRTKRTRDQRDIAELIDPPLRAVDRKTRWMVLLTASNNDYGAIIQDAYSGKVVPDSYEWKHARQRIYDAVKSYKHKVLERVIAHVQSIKKIERLKGTLFPDLEDAGHLFKEFVRMYKKESFFEVFYYMDGYVDIDASSELGKWYLMNIYANLCVRAKRLVDFMDAHPNAPCLDERKKVSDFYLRMTNHSDFDQVDKTCFAEIFSKSLRERISKKFKPNMLADDDPDYVLSAPPPPKSSSASSSIY